MMSIDHFNGVTDAPAPDEIRRLVAEVLAEVLPGLGRQAARSAPLPDTGGPPAESPAVRLAASLAGRSSAVPGSVPAAAGVPSGVPSGTPSSGPPPAGAEPAAPDAGPDSWTVRLSNDTELAEFVLRVLKLADNPKLRRDLISGRIRFTLAGQSAGPAVRAVHRVDKGAVTERTVAAAASAGARLVLGRRAVLTPLARDKARALGVPIEKER